MRRLPSVEKMDGAFETVTKSFQILCQEKNKDPLSRPFWLDGRVSALERKSSPYFAPAEPPGTPYLCDTCNGDDLTEYQCVAKIMSGYHNKKDNAIRSQNNF
jgi:hypothetical protein